MFGVHCLDVAAQLILAVLICSLYFAQLNSAVDVSFTHFAVLLPDSIHENLEIGQKPRLKGVRPGYWPCCIMLSLPRGGRDFFGPAVVLQGLSCGLGGRHMAQIRKISSKFQICDYGNQIDKKLLFKICLTRFPTSYHRAEKSSRYLRRNVLQQNALQIPTIHVNIISKHPDTAGHVCILHDASSRFVGP